MKRISVVAISLLMLLPAAANASSGEITKAYANETWTEGKLAGTVTWDGCPGGPCVSWQAFVTVQLTDPVYKCLGDEAIDSDPNTRNFNTGLKRQTSNGTVSFDSEGYILQGVHGQRACLSVIYTYKRRDPVCVAQAPIFGDDPNVVCPLVNTMGSRVLDTRLLGVEPAVVEPPVTEPPTTDPHPDLTAAQAKRIAKRKLARKYGRSWKRGSRKRVKCRAKPTKYKCNAKWKYKGKRKHGSVVVPK